MFLQHLFRWHDSPALLAFTTLSCEVSHGQVRGTQQEVGTVVNVDDYNGQTFYVYNATTQYCYKVSVGQMVEDRAVCARLVVRSKVSRVVS